MRKVLLKFRSVQFFCLRGFSEKCVTQIYRALFSDASHVGNPLRNTDMIWRPKTHRNIAIKRVLINLILIPKAKTVQMKKI